jgi:hypothetical protein
VRPVWRRSDRNRLCKTQKSRIGAGLYVDAFICEPPVRFRYARFSVNREYSIVIQRHRFPDCFGEQFLCICRLKIVLPNGTEQRRKKPSLRALRILVTLEGNQIDRSSKPFSISVVIVG